MIQNDRVSQIFCRYIIDERVEGNEDAERHYAERALHDMIKLMIKDCMVLKVEYLYRHSVYGPEYVDRRNDRKMSRMGYRYEGKVHTMKVLAIKKERVDEY